MRQAFLTALLFLIAPFLFGQGWQSQLVWEDAEGHLQYRHCDKGFLLPDFSHAGYKGGGIDLPQMNVVKTIEPIAGDNTAHIQAAINEVGTRTANTQGLRGALLLKAGIYEIHGTLRVPFSGMVLRGEGDGADPAFNTVLFAKGNTPHQRDVLVVGNSTKSNWNSQISGSKSNITSELVPVGTHSFDVEDASLYAVGDQIIIYHPCTQEWLEAIGFGGVSDPNELWSVNQFPIVYNRYIAAIDNNTLTVEAPLFYSLNKSLAQSYIYKPNMSGTVYNVGIENLRIDIETLGGTDENHAWQAVRFKSCENAWAKDCSFVHFGQSGIITEATSRSSFVNCKALDPVAIITGERMYNFNTYHFSQLNLFDNCYARNGRHNYVSNGTSTTSGNVFLNSISDGAHSVNEGHRHWTSGMLFDGHQERNLRREFVLGLYNRVDAGTGHGWSAVHSVLWNCDVTSGGIITLHEPPGAQNYAIGCMAKSITGRPYSSIDFPLGYVEGTNQSGLYPESLYEAQLADRKGISSAISATHKSQSDVLFFSQKGNSILFLGDSASGRGGCMLCIYNMSGSIMFQQVVDNMEQGQVLNTALSTGVYLLTLSGPGIRYAQKIIMK